MKSKLLIAPTLLSLLIGTALATSPSAPSTPQYSNIFISYVSPPDVSALATYSSTKKLGGYIMWTLQGDINPENAVNGQLSLLKALSPTASKDYPAATSPMVMAYWTNWGMYGQTHAIPLTAYPIPGSQVTTGGMATNQDFLDKLPYINTLTYSFLEAQATMYTYIDAAGSVQQLPNLTPNLIGTLYFNDPWADLLPAANDSGYLAPLPIDSFCLNQPICSYAATTRGELYSEVTARMGNFEAFANLPKAYPYLQTYISVGGYAHDNSFEDSFNAPGSDPSVVNGYMKNFVNSAIVNTTTGAPGILVNYKLTGIDLDYEDPTMTLGQSQNFFTLVNALNTAAAAQGKFITVTILANPAYLTGVKPATDKQGKAIPGTIGFDATYQPKGLNCKGVLQCIASLSNVKMINLMTYDFHGAFDYAEDSNGNPIGRTGFLSNLYMPTPIPKDYNPLFSIQTSVDALVNQPTQPITMPSNASSTLTQIITPLGINPAKVGVGIPAYGRALTGISPGGSGTGLFSIINKGDNIIPRGDLDASTCDQTIPLPAPTAGAPDYGISNSCSGSFTYQYIVNTLLNSGFTAAPWTNNITKVSNGTTAFSNSFTPKPPANFSLEITNTGNGGQAAIQVIISGKNNIGGYASVISNNLSASYVGPTAELPFHCSQTTPSCDNTYDGETTTPSVGPIEGLKGLTVKIVTYVGGPSGMCQNPDGTPMTFDFTQGTHILAQVKPGAQWPAVDIICTIQNLPG